MKSAWSVYVWQSDGLPDKKVTGIAQTRDGYLWVSTPAGVARFDGVSFETISINSSLQKRNNKIRLLLPTREGKLWLATDRGPVICLNSGNATFFTDDAFNSTPLSLVEDREGSIWISYHGGAVCRIRNDKVAKFTTQNGLPAHGDCTLAEDCKGQLWFARAGEVGVLRGEHFVSLQTLHSSSLLLARARTGGVWICSDGQLFKYNIDEQLKACGSPNFKGNPGAIKPEALIEDHSGSVWIGTSHNGLVRYNGDDFENIPTSHQEILSLMEDREYNIWAGTGGGGIDRIQPRCIELEGMEVGLPSESIRSICEDSDGLIWAATQNGLLVRRTSSGWGPISGTDNLPEGAVTCVASDRTGLVWISTNAHKLYCWRKDHCVATWGQPEGLTKHSITALLVSKTGDVWINNDGSHGVQCLSQGKLYSYKLPPNSYKVRAMVEDSFGNIWMGLKNGFLVRATAGVLTDESAKIEGVPKSINCLCSTADGSVWIGFSNGGGLGQFKDGHFTRFGLEQGLYDDNIAQIVDDNRGWLWFGTDHGIFKARKQQLEERAAGSIDRVQCVRYGKNEGLPNLQANFDDVAGTLRSQDGRLWFPMGPALAVVNPNRQSEFGDRPQVLLKSIVRDAETIAGESGTFSDAKKGAQKIFILPGTDSTLQIRPGPRRLKFEFTALSFKSPEDVQFQYRLDGFDEHWIDGGTQRSASYTQLPAKNYTFRVKARNSDGIWNEKGATIAFTVAPFVWETWWFRTVVLILCTLGVFAFTRYISLRQLRRKLQAFEQQAELDKERTRIARDLHDELGSRLTKIAMLSELAQLEYRNPDRVTERTRQLSLAARQVIKSLDETVWAINPRNDTLENLVNYIGQAAFEFLKLAEIECHVDFLDHSFDRPVSAAVRHCLLLVVQEALHNVVKHASASEVRLGVRLTGEVGRFTIEDNGRGFDGFTQKPDSDGLRNMSHRMNEIGGKFSISSDAEGGTRILLDFSLLAHARGLLFD